MCGDASADKKLFIDAEIEASSVMLDNGRTLGAFYPAAGEYTCASLCPLLLLPFLPSSSLFLPFPAPFFYVLPHNCLNRLF